MKDRTTIKKLFYDEDIQFAIPAYQRAFSWECDKDRKQIEQFITDIKEQDPSKKYFLGHFLFEAKPNENKYWVIDGQQRLTTIVIFFSCLIRELEKRERQLADPISDENGEQIEIWRIRENYIKLGKYYKFSTVEYDKIFFENLIFEDNDEGNVYDTASKRRILRAKKAFEELFSKADIPTILSWKKIIDEAVITTFKVDDKIQSTQIFAFQNDRGKDLTNLEKLKAFLMHKIYSFSENDNAENLIKNLENEFSDIYKQSERISYDEDRVLGFHNIAFLSGGENALNNVKSIVAETNENSEKIKWIKDFVLVLRETFYSVETIEKKLEHNNAIADTLILDEQNSMPLLIKLYHFHKNDENSIIDIMKIVENILFKLIYKVADYRTNILPSIARNYRGNINELKENLSSYSKKGFQDWWNFKENCKNYFTNNNYHYFSNIKYILWKYENYIREEKRMKLLTPNEYKNKYESKRKENTIDHITPQYPNFTKYTEDFINDFLNNIGNLGLMVWGDNSEKSNYNPVEKLDLFEKDFISNNEIKKTIEINKKWEKEEITERKNNIIKFIFDNWKLE